MVGSTRGVYESGNACRATGRTGTLKRTHLLENEAFRTSRRVAASIWHLAVGANELVIGVAVALAHPLRFGTTRATGGWARFTGLLGPAA